MVLRYYLLLAILFVLPVSGCLDDEPASTDKKGQVSTGAPGNMTLTLSGERTFSYQNEGSTATSKVTVSVTGDKTAEGDLHKTMRQNLDTASDAERNSFYGGAGLTTAPPAPLSTPAVSVSKTIAAPVTAEVDWAFEEKKFREEYSPAKAAAILPGIQWITNKNIKPTGDPTAKVGGTLISGQENMPSCLRYLGKNASTAFNHEMAMLCYEALLGFDYDTMEYSPGLADKWFIHPDKQTFFFHLDPEAKFSDGVRVTARDVVATWKLNVDSGVEDPFQNDYWRKYFEPIALADEVVVVRAKEKVWRSMLSFSNSLLIWPAHILDKIDGAQFLKQFQWDFLPGTGPYTFDKTDRTSFINLKRCPNYWAVNRPEAKGLYNFELLRYVFVTDENLLRERFKAGELDWYLENTARRWVKESDYKQVQKGWIQKRRVFTKRPIGISGLAFNIRKPPFDDIRVRKAFCLLRNRKKLIEKLFLNQYLEQNSEFPGMPYENPNNPRNEYDPAAAIELLKEAGWTAGPDGMLQKDGQKFEIVMNFLSPSDQRIHTVFQEDLANVGIRLNLKQVTWATDIKEIGERNFTLTSRAYTGLMFPNPENSLHSKFADVPDTNNIQGYKNPRTDQLCETYNQEFDAKIRVEMLKEIDGIVAHEYLWALGWYAPYSRVMFWNKFGYPKGVLGKYTFGDQRDITRLWWHDADKEKILKQAIEKEQDLPVGETDDTYWNTH